MLNKKEELISNIWSTRGHCGHALCIEKERQRAIELLDKYLEEHNEPMVRE